MTTNDNDNKEQTPIVPASDDMAYGESSIQILEGLEASQEISLPFLTSAQAKHLVTESTAHAATFKRLSFFF